MTAVEGRLTSVEGRLTSVEGRLTSVEGLLTSVEAQIVQLLSEMNGGFSALSYAINAMNADMVARFEAQDQKFEDLRREMHLLHEDVLERIARLGER
jgi:hypothetical protein